jgi:putative FmdB family regulatory protein
MPLYEYKCSACSHRFERWERLTAPSVQACPQCGEPAQRQLGAPALQFKGSGWYVTDYAKGSASAPQSERSESSPSSKDTSTNAADSSSSSSSSSETSSKGGDGPKDSSSGKAA